MKNWRELPRKVTDSFIQPQACISVKAWRLWALAVFLIPYWLTYIYALNDFYHFGVPYADSGLFAHLLWHNDWHLANPHYRGDFSYFGVHYSPLLLLLNGLSYVVPAHMVEFCAGWRAALYASAGLALFYAFTLFLKPKTQWNMAFLALVAMGLSFNSVMTHSLWMVHFEYAIPLGIFVFLLLYCRRRHVAAAVVFGMTLMLREDAGFHLAMVLGLLALIGYYEKRRFSAVRSEVILALVASYYSLFALWIVGRIASDADAAQVIVFIYLGKEPFAHITLAMLMERIGTVWHRHMPIFLAMLATLIGAWRMKNPYLLAGFAASIPWLAVNLMALNPNTGVLYAYYSFPFLLGFAWPFLGSCWRYGYPLPPGSARASFILQAVLVLTGLLTWNKGPAFILQEDTRGGSFHVQESLRNRERIQDFIGQFDAGAGDLGIIIADPGILSLTSAAYHGNYIIPIKRSYGKGDAVRYPRGDTVLYLKAGRPARPDPIWKIARHNNLAHRFCLTGTSICMYTSRTQEQVKALSGYLVTAD